MNQNVGISSLGISFPPLYMNLSELAKLRGVEPEKYTVGLGTHEMSLCGNQCTVVNLAVDAAREAIEAWGGRVEDIALIAVGTETPVDYSRPLSAWVAKELGIEGYVRSYEVKHACYGGTLAIMQAVEWYLSKNEPNKVALVIAVDEALYLENSPGEPTQGAGAIAFIIGEPRLAIVSPHSIAYSIPVFDFWKPLDKHYPEVDGHFSLECYKRAAVACFNAMVQDQDQDPLAFLSQYAAICFHVPFPKMVIKAFTAIGEQLKLSVEQINQLYQSRIAPFMGWNQRCGNAYTASLWIMFANALCNTRKNERLLVFSYGSGMGSELMTWSNNAEPQQLAWKNTVEQKLNQREPISGKTYQSIRALKPAA